MKVKTRDMQEFEKNKLENEEICLEEGIQSRKTPKKEKAKGARVGLTLKN